MAKQVTLASSVAQVLEAELAPLVGEDRLRVEIDQMGVLRAPMTVVAGAARGLVLDVFVVVTKAGIAECSTSAEIVQGR